MSPLPSTVLTINDEREQFTLQDDDLDLHGVDLSVDGVTDDAGTIVDNLASCRLEGFVCDSDTDDWTAGGNQHSVANAYVAGGTPDPDGALEMFPVPHSRSARREGDKTGKYTSHARLLRKRKAPKVPVIEISKDEPVDCGAISDDKGTSACLAQPRCAMHGSTHFRQWLVRGPVRGYSDDAECLSSVWLVHAAAWMPALEVYNRLVARLALRVYDGQLETME